MAADISDYTDTNAIRGALLLDEDEIPDEMLVNQNLDVALISDLDDWLPSHAAIWEDGFAADAEPDEIKRQRFLQLYAMWFCALRVAEGYPSWPQQMTDGKMEIRRFQQIDFEKMLSRCLGHVDKYKRALLVSLGEAITASTQVPVFVSGVRAAYDPVRGGTDNR